MEIIGYSLNALVTSFVSEEKRSAQKRPEVETFTLPTLSAKRLSGLPSSTEED